jgi:hypothetical protein
MKKNLLLFVCILTLFTLSLWAKDFGLILDQSAGFGDSNGDNELDYSGALIPWFSSPAGGKGNVFLSASVMADFKYNAMKVIPELLRTEFTWSFNKGEFTFGRMMYKDPLGFITDGLFDGACVSLDLGGGSFNVGTWYTGLQYKERARITMTKAEQESYNADFNFSNFLDTYFAPRRVVSAFGWEHQGLAEIIQLKFAIINQSDLAREDSLHSQYAAAKLSVPLNAFVFDLGGCLELIESQEEIKFALVGTFGVSWMLPSARLSLSGRYSSGTAKDGSLTAFLPLSTVYQGEILKAKLSGLSVFSLDYLGKFHKTFSAGLNASCFLRSDLGTYNGYPVSSGSGDGYILGTELFGRLSWSLFSDIQINCGAGAFFPYLGNAAKDTGALWRAEINVILALY